MEVLSALFLKIGKRGLVLTCNYCTTHRFRDTDDDTRYSLTVAPTGADNLSGWY